MAENGCETAARVAGFPDAERAALIREAFRLEWFTVAWMTVEAIVAIAAGIAAQSVTLLAFGIDSLIELASAGVLIWRLSVELKHGRAFSVAAEHTASRIAGGLLFALTAYVVVAAGWGLWRGEGQAFSLPGLIVTGLAIPLMYLLAKRKLSDPSTPSANYRDKSPSRRRSARARPRTRSAGRTASPRPFRRQSDFLAPPPMRVRLKIFSRSRILPLRNPSNCRHELRHKFVISRKTSSNNHFLVALEISTKTVDNLVENTGTAGSR
jgi:hypothetical protein